MITVLGEKKIIKSKNVINMTLTFDFNCLAYFDISNIRDFHWLLLYFKSCSVWKRSMVFLNTGMQCFFWSSFSSLGTIFGTAQLAGSVEYTNCISTEG